MRRCCHYCCCCETETPRVLFTLGPASEQGGPVVPTPRYKGRHSYGVPDVATKITATQDLPITARFVDKKGNPAPVDGIPEWLVDNPNLVALTPAADGLTC